MERVIFAYSATVARDWFGEANVKRIKPPQLGKANILIIRPVTAPEWY